MLVWCSYCQSYIYEKEPLSNFSISHSICKKCKKDPSAIVKDDNFKRIKSFFEEILFAAKQGRKLHYQEIIERGNDLGIAPLDLFQGIIQPILWEIGEEFAKGKFPIEKEYQFTTTSEQILAEIENKIRVHNTQELDVLLTCPKKNIHYLGIRSIHLQLIDKGYRSEVIYPGISHQEIYDRIQKKKPKILGLTFSLLDQLNRFLNDPLFLSEEISDTHILLGGSLFKTQEISTQNIPKRFHVIKRVDDLFELLANSKNNKVA